MDEKEITALAELVHTGTRKAGRLAVLAEKLGWRQFEDTEETAGLVRVLLEDVPVAIGAQKTVENAWRRIAAAAENGAGEEALAKAAQQLEETAHLTQEALDDVHGDLVKLAGLAK